jgi:hypothetical protein
MKLKNELKREIIAMNSHNGLTPDWVLININKLVDRAFELLQTGKAKDNFDAAFKATDECF